MSSLSNLTPLCKPQPFSGRQFITAGKSISSSPNFSLSPKLNLGNSTSMSQLRSSVTANCNSDVTIHNEKSSNNREKGIVLRVGLICGGPSMERGISLNSARSVLDHIQGDDLDVSCYYIDCELNAYAISSAQLYSNTPADFDFKLDSLAQGFGCVSDFLGHLAASVDIVFPVIHGPFGEDGTLQELLETANIPFVGTRSTECRKAFDKHEASLHLDRNGFLTVPNFLVQGSESDETNLVRWFERNQLDVRAGKVVVKPARGGSSIGVSVAYGVVDSFKKATQIISEGVDDKALVEIFLEGGREFTAIVIDMGIGSECSPVVLLPTEEGFTFSTNFEGDKLQMGLTT